MYVWNKYVYLYKYMYAICKRGYNVYIYMLNYVCKDVFSVLAMCFLSMFCAENGGAYKPTNCCRPNGAVPWEFVNLINHPDSATGKSWEFMQGKEIEKLVDRLQESVFAWF